MTRDPLGFCKAALEDLDGRGLLRHLRTLESGPEPEVDLDGRRVLLLASNNYLGLATHPRVVAAAADALARWGVGAGSARLITGNTSIHDALEAQIARFKGTEDAVLFSSGYHANVGTIPALVGRGDAVFSDALNHASIIDGIRLSRAEKFVYPHVDLGALEDDLALWSRRCPGQRALVVTESVFSMDGDAAPLEGVIEICRRHGAMLMVDEAHATGVIGDGGRGLVAGLGLEDGVDVLMGTLSKALGAAGGFVAGTRSLCDFLRNRARSFVFDTGMPAVVAAAALEALRVLLDEPGLADAARSRSRALASGLRRAGYDVPEPVGAIVPVILGEARSALEAAGGLLERDVLVPAIRPPTVPDGTARLRATVMATHTESHIERAVEAFSAIRTPA